MNIYDIAEKAGVSIATVSRVINNSGSVSSKTRRRVTDIISQNNYIPGTNARSGKIRGPVGVICSPRNRQLILPLLQSLERINIFPEVIFCDDDRLNLKKNLDRLSELNAGFVIMDGYNLAGNEQRSGMIHDFAAKIPVIMLGAFIDCPGIYCIACPEQALIADITLSYIKKGITEILFLFSSLNFGCTEILQSYRSAFVTGGLSDDCGRAHLCPSGFDEAYAYVSELSASGKLPGLIIASDDELAAGVLKATVSSGINVPQQLEIIGIGNTSISKYCNPELSTIDCHTDKICEQAVSVLSALMHKSTAPTRTVLNPVLIKKGTTL